MSQYPKQEEIMTLPAPEYPEKVIKEIKAFKKRWQKYKKEFWPWDITKHKMQALADMLHNLGELYGENPAVDFDLTAHSCYYDLKTKTIYINGSLSILSSLHEFGHHLLGNSELDACRWSVHLFKEVFPKAFVKLKWQQHMLIQE